MKVLGILFAVITLMSLLRLIEKRDVDRLAAFTGWGTATLMCFLNAL
jgi:hypothetical protein